MKLNRRYKVSVAALAALVVPFALFALVVRVRSRHARALAAARQRWYARAPDSYRMQGIQARDFDGDGASDYAYPFEIVISGGQLVSYDVDARLPAPVGASVEEWFQYVESVIKLRNGCGLRHVLDTCSCLRTRHDLAVAYDPELGYPREIEVRTAWNRPFQQLHTLLFTSPKPACPLSPPPSAVGGRHALTVRVKVMPVARNSY